MWSVTSRANKVILALWPTLMRSHLVYCIQLWAAQHRKDIELLEQVQREATKLSRGMENRGKG